MINSLRVAFKFYSHVHVSFQLPVLHCQQYRCEFVAICLHFLDLFKAVFTLLELLIAISQPNVVPLLIHPHKVLQYLLVPIQYCKVQRCETLQVSFIIKCVEAIPDKLDARHSLHKLILFQGGVIIWVLQQLESFSQDGMSVFTRAIIFSITFEKVL